MDTRFDLSAVLVLERLVELIQGQGKELRELAEEVRGLREAVERLLSRRFRVERLREGEWLSVHQLGEEEVKVVELFLGWMRENWFKWLEMYKSGKLEGVDRDRGLVYLSRKVILEFLDRVSDLGYLRSEVLRLLGDLGVLRFKVKDGGKRQYCLPVRMRLVGVGEDGRVIERSVVGSRYVVEVERLSEVSRELRERKEAEGSGQVVEGSGQGVGGSGQGVVGSDQVGLGGLRGVRDVVEEGEPEEVRDEVEGGLGVDTEEGSSGSSEEGIVF